MKQGFVIHHNGPDTNLDGKPHAACVGYWTGVRRYHMESKGWSDIAYSFGVCHHGNRFVGRGWDRNQFANGSDTVGPDDGKDSEWYTVLVFLGWNDAAADPVDEEPSPEMIEAVRDLIAEGRDSGRCGTRVLPHNAFKSKRCPGAAFTELAAQWNHAPLDAPPEDDMFSDEDRKIQRRIHDALGLSGVADAHGNIRGRVDALYLHMKADAGDGVDDLDELVALVKSLPAATVKALKDAL